MSFRVQLTQVALGDIDRLFDFILERELQHHNGDLNIADRALQAIQNGIFTLQTTPFTCRKSGTSPFLRELVIPFGHAGYVALFEIVDSNNVVMAAVRHQLEDDYH
jgi:plasmid stabilization system protein ParE